MYSLYRIVVGASQYALSAVKLIMETVLYQWVHLACLIVFQFLVWVRHDSSVDKQPEKMI